MKRKKFKKIIKYITNALAIIIALITGINAIDGITIPYAIQIVKVIIVVQGVISTYLITDSQTTKSKIKKLSNQKGE